MAIKSTMLLKYQLVFLMAGKLFVIGEWVEMPQFSDESKIYKLSSYKQNLFNTFLNNEQEIMPDYYSKTLDQLSHEFGNTDREMNRKIILHESEDSVHSWISTTINPSYFSKESSFNDHLNDSVNISSEEPKIISDLKKVVPNDIESSTSAVPVTLELPMEESSASTTSTSITPAMIAHESSSNKIHFNNETIKDVKLENYLPIEMLRKVHETLKSQPSTFSGKIWFLKQFEKNLLSEIEMRLSKALAPVRRTRGAHDYYDHDDELGFPSLEGALMAISFLTFAVYLVRLVMLLFRNTNNTTTAATIFFGRNRRSTDELTKQTEEILNYLNTFNIN